MSEQKKHALVVGASRGSGRFAALTLAREGFQVSAFGRRPAAQAGEFGENVRYRACDILCADSFEQAFQAALREHGPWSALVFFQRFRGAPGDASGEYAVSIQATQRIIEMAAGDAAQPAGGAIVLVGSLAGRLVAPEQDVFYHACKAALAHMARYYAVRLGPQGIRVNCISPAVVLKEESRAFYESQEALLKLYREIIPLGRMGTSQDIADLTAFLCGERSSYITGQDIVIDGGIGLQAQEGLARRLTGTAPQTVTATVKGK